MPIFLIPRSCQSVTRQLGFRDESGGCPLSAARGMRLPDNGSLIQHVGPAILLAAFDSWSARTWSAMGEWRHSDLLLGCGPL